MKNAEEKTGDDGEVYQRYIEDKYSKEDIEYITHQLNNGSDLQLKRTCKDNWYHHFINRVASEDELDFSPILDRIHHRLNLKDNSPIGPRSPRPANRIIKATLNIYYRIAAIIVLGLILTGLFNYVNNKRFIPEAKVAYTEVFAPMGSKLKVDLPDNSTAWLNNGTILRYPLKYGRRSRELYVSGEAYFDVKKEKHRPFILKTSDVDIHVMGTTFNVMAYENEQDIEVTIETGELELYNCSGEPPHGKITSLKAGEHIKINKELLSYSKHTGNLDIYTSWKEGVMVFRGNPLDVIVKKLERWYNVDIQLLNDELSDYTFTATFTDETLQQVLYLLSLAVPIEYEITTRVKQSDDTFSKSKVFIGLKN